MAEPINSPLSKLRITSSNQKILISAFVLVSCSAAGFLSWQYFGGQSNDEIDATPSLIRQDNAGRMSGTAKNPSLEVVSGGKSEARLKSLKGRSRLLEMAIVRGEQWEKLSPGNPAQTGVALDSAPALNSNAVSPLLSGDTRKLQDYARKLDIELNDRRKQFGADNLLSAESAIEKTLVMEKLQEGNETELAVAVQLWQGSVRQLLALASKSGKNDAGSAVLKGLITGRGMLRICSWFHSSGEILAMLLWGHQHNKEALSVVQSILAVDKLPKYGVMESPLAVHRLLALSRLCASQNEYGEARQLISAARTIAGSQVSAGLSHRFHSLSMCLLEESRLSLSQRDFNAAAELAKQAAELIKQAPDLEAAQSKALRADVLEQLSRSLAAVPGKLSESIENQEKCLKLRQENFGVDGVNTWSTKLELARMLRARLAASCPDGQAADPKSEDAKRADELLQNILLVCNRNQQSDSEVLRTDRNANLVLPQTYSELGLLACTCGNFVQAREYLQKACRIDSSFSELSLIPFKVSELDALAAVDLHENKFEQARNTVLKASALLNNYVADILPQLSLSEQIAFTDNIEKHMNSLLSVCRDDSALPLLYSEMIRWKGFLIEQFRLRASVIRGHSDTKISALLKEHQKLSSNILRSYVGADPPAPNFERAQRENQLRKEEIERQINTLIRGKQKESLSINSLDLQNCLDKKETLVDLYEFADSPWNGQGRYGAVVVGKKTMRWVDLGPSKKINGALALWRSYGGIRTVLAPDLTDGERQKHAGTDNPWQVDYWADLRKLIYEPISKAIAPDVSHLLIADESELSRLPWSVLLSSYAGPRSFEVCQVDSPRELINLRHRVPSAGARKEILIVGGIDYSKHVPPAPPLKHALREVREIEKAMKNQDLPCEVQSDELSGKRPTRDNVVDALAKCRLAHVVTHGFFNSSDSAPGSLDRSAKLNADTRQSAESFQGGSRNPLIESGLLISRGSKSGEGFFTAEDILDVNLDGCKLVTLSACETARGRELSGQGVLGLRSALMGAGSRAVLLSLWPVPDKPTSELMKVFYEKLLSGKCPVEALKDAQAALRKNPDWRAPYYWAAWIVVGDGWQSF